MKFLFDAVDFGLLLIDPSGQIELANRWLRERSRLPQGPEGRPLAAAFDAPVDPRLNTAVRHCLDFGNSIRLSQAFHPMPLPLFRPDEPAEQRMRQAIDVIAVEAPANGGRRCLLQVRDVTESVRREQLLRSQAQQLGTELRRLTEAHREIERQSTRFREMARLAPVGLFETDEQGHLSYFNARVAEMLQRDPEAAVGHRWTELFIGSGAGVESLAQRWLAAASTGVRFGDEFSIERGGQAVVWMRLEATPLRDAAQQAYGHIFTLVDVTELREQARHHELRANHDAMTGLANRARFEQRIQELLQLACSQPVQAAVMFIDLDRFKAVNDTHGHRAGDLVLKAVSARIRRCVRGEDLVARLGGDEFAVLLSSLDDESVISRVADKITKSVKLPINIGNCHVRVGASIGWSHVPQQGGDVASVLQRADAAMYRSKRERAGTAETSPGALPA